MRWTTFPSRCTWPYAAILNQKILGLPDTVLVEVTLTQHDDEALERFGRAVTAFPEVVEAYLVSGEFDYLIKVAVAGTEGYEDFLRHRLYKLAGVRHSRSVFTCFRQALSARGLLWAVGLSRRQNVYPADIALTSPVAKTGKRRKYHVPDRPPVSADVMLAKGKWKKITWRRGTKGRLTCLFAACRVRVADGHKHRMLDNRVQCMPGDEVWRR